ncbi:MAG: type I-E CRISPR-associated protein Cse2/CasB [Deltaproteobacteria bacterium]|nr:type I-E CRISPR-associated protein Cse2/CasB [Deltaproteobacteria bacterium]
MSFGSEEKSRFIRYLEDLVQRRDRGALAHLRRGLGKAPGTVMEMHRYVVPFLPKERAWTEDSHYLVAALFAYWHQGKDAVAPSPPANLGTSLAQMATDANEDSLDRRFTALLKSHPDDLPMYLRQAVGLLKSQDVPVNWQQLMKDISNWYREDNLVQRRWAQAFWGRRTAADTTPETEHTSE